MAQPSHQQLLLDLFPSKKTQRRNTKDRVMYQTGSTTAKMKVLPLKERDPGSFKDKSLALKPENISNKEEDPSCHLDKLLNYTSYNHWQPIHLGSNWANTDNKSSQEILFTPIHSTKKCIEMTNQSYINLGDDAKSQDLEQHKLGWDIWEQFLSSALKGRRIEQKRQFFNYLGLGRRNEKGEEKVDKPSGTANESSLAKLSNSIPYNSKPISSKERDEYLNVDITSEMGKQVARIGILNEESTIDINNLTSGCPKRLSTRSGTKTDNFFVTFKRPKEKRKIKQIGYAERLILRPRSNGKH